MATPYTYLVKHNPTGTFYYGVQYSKNCHPDNLWKTYFTSSDYVTALIEEHGKDSFSVEVRKTFTSKNKAIKWEKTVLRKLDVAKNDKFINRNAGGLISYHSRCWVKKDKSSKLIQSAMLQEYLDGGWIKGRHFSDEHRAKISTSTKKRLQKQGNPMAGKKHSKATRLKNSVSQLEWRKKDKAFRLPVWIDGVEYKSMIEAQRQTGLSRWIIKKYHTVAPRP
ncbi:MAG: NUMOD3 domain-containing DNA-binding protein [bacterium]|jgi:hypothetical protein